MRTAAVCWSLGVLTLVVIGCGGRQPSSKEIIDHDFVFAIDGLRQPSGIL